MESEDRAWGWLFWRTPRFMTAMSQDSSVSCLLSSQGLGFPDGSNGNASTSHAGDLGSIPGLGRSPGGGNGNPLQHACLQNSMNRGDWRVTVHGVAKSWT